MSSLPRPALRSRHRDTRNTWPINKRLEGTRALPLPKIPATDPTATRGVGPTTESGAIVLTVDAGLRSCPRQAESCRPHAFSSSSRSELGALAPGASHGARGPPRAALLVCPWSRWGARQRGNGQRPAERALPLRRASRPLHGPADGPGRPASEPLARVRRWLRAVQVRRSRGNRGSCRPGDDVSSPGVHGVRCPGTVAGAGHVAVACPIRLPPEVGA